MLEIWSPRVEEEEEVVLESPGVETPHCRGARVTNHSGGGL